ncbi:hypothetical protein [Nostoc sp. TCL26-01]|uniref:hypothetical protein n=1 Tax=Nostoc sp. TCL26-01 TaxID=2576904 RepID=UPI0015BB1B4C|nr:hypothetical protein [Nostoc sp. TCL26-01]QLE57459.1 hypothetical protein FD725_19230 [Nostoc sp. TCL26-01]
MLKLIEYFSQDKRCVGYVWKQDQGQKVIVVIDDCFRLVKYDQPPNAHGYGLKVIFDKLSRYDDTLAIGFFDLPQSTEPEDIQLIINTIKSWVIELDTQHYKLYLLVDYFHGQDMQESKAHGLEVVDYWYEHQPLQAEKIAHLSIGGGDLRNPHNLECFRKTSIHEHKEDHKLLPQELLHWLDIEEHPLSQLWRYSDRWFLNDERTTLVKHDFAEVRKFLFKAENDDDESSDYQAKEYKRKIGQALQLNIPNVWWEIEESANNIHESLKCLAGAFFCGQTNINAKRNISVGAAYLIALMAHQKVYGNIDVFTQDADAWSHCSQTSSPVFALQDQETARKSAIALYDLFFCLFTPRKQNDYQEHSSGNSLVRNVCFYKAGKVLRIQLNWNAQKPSSDRSESLAQSIKGILNQPTIDTYQFAQNTRNAFCNLLRQIAISESGFMGPGTIYMEADTLVIASTK